MILKRTKFQKIGAANDHPEMKYREDSSDEEDPGVVREIEFGEEVDSRRASATDRELGPPVEMCDDWGAMDDNLPQSPQYPLPPIVQPGSDRSDIPDFPSSVAVVEE